LYQRLVSELGLETTEEQPTLNEQQQQMLSVLRASLSSVPELFESLNQHPSQPGTLLALQTHGQRIVSALKTALEQGGVLDEAHVRSVLTSLQQQASQSSQSQQQLQAQAQALAQSRHEVQQEKQHSAQLQSKLDTLSQKQLDLALTVTEMEEKLQTMQQEKEALERKNQELKMFEGAVNDMRKLFEQELAEAGGGV